MSSVALRTHAVSLVLAVVELGFKVSTLQGYGFGIRLQNEDSHPLGYRGASSPESRQFR